MHDIFDMHQICILLKNELLDIKCVCCRILNLHIGVFLYDSIAEVTVKGLL